MAEGLLSRIRIGKGVLTSAGMLASLAQWIELKLR